MVKLSSIARAIALQATHTAQLLSLANVTALLQDILMRPLALTRVLATLIVTNFVCLVVLNLFEMRPAAMPIIYAISSVCIYYILGQWTIKRSSIKPDRYTRMMVLLTLIALTLPRIPYLFDWISDTTVLVIADDYARLAELVSMTLSDHYPLVHPANTHYLLSFYYTAFYPLVLFKTVFPILTLKNSIFFGCLVYNILVLGSFVEIGCLLFNSQRSMRIFVFLCTLFGGFDFGLELWQSDVFNANTMISSFYNGIFWTIHHFISFYAILIAYIILYRTRFRHQTYKYSIIAALIASSFYSSPFSFAPLLFFVPYQRILIMKMLRNPICWIVFVASLIPLYIFINKLPGQTFIPSTFRIAVTNNFVIDKIVSFPVYIFLIPVIEVAGIPLLLYSVLGKMKKVEKRFYFSSIAFFLLTYVVAYSGYNNLSMRGMFLPTLVWFALFAKYNHYFIKDSFIASLRTHRTKRIAVVTLLTLSINPLYQQFTSLGNTLTNTSLTYTLFNRPAPSRLKPIYAKLSHNSEVSIYTPDDIDRYTQHRYNAEKLLSPTPLNEMQEWERELLRMPREGFFR